ncbi:hypothetical protein [Ekhidna sp.]
MDLYFYHFQEIIYWGAGVYLLFKFLLNYFVHQAMDSYIYNLEKFEGVGRYGNSNRTRSSQHYEQGFLYFFTTWWEIKKSDSKYLKRTKRLSNFINISSIFLIVGLIFFFLYMQDANHSYRHLDKDPWQYLL